MNPPTQRAVLYGRVSAVMGRGDDLTSPELQERVVRDYCERQGYDPLLWLCDVDMTGSSWSRRSVEQAVKMIEAGEADVIVVPRWSRFTRNLRDYVMQTARIEAAGGRVESVQEGTDPATAAGLFQRDLFVVFAQWESRKIGEGWKETHQRRRRAGLPHDGRARLGYQLVNGGYLPHPTEGPIVTSLYRRYLAGSGTAALADWLTTKGIGSSRAGKQWTGVGIRGFMTSGFPAGLIRVGDGFLPGAHKPLISQATWKRFLAERDDRYPKRTRLPAPATALAELVHCGNCGHKSRLRAKSSTHGRLRFYIYLCEGRTCDNQMWITRHILEAEVKAWLEQSQPQPQTVLQTDHLELERQLVRIDDGLIKNRVEYALGEYDAPTRNRVERSLNQRRGEALRRLGQASAPVSHFNVEAAANLARSWDSWSPERINDALTELVGRINVLRLPGVRQRTIAIDAK